MSLKLEIKVPIKSANKRFISKFYNLNEPIILSDKNSFGTFTRLLFSKSTVDRVSVPTSFSKFDDTLHLSVPKEMVAQSRFTIDTKHWVKLDAFIDKLFREELKRNILAGEKVKLDQKDIVADFLIDYGMNEFYQVDSLLKDFRRKNGTKHKRNTYKKDIKTS